MYFLTAGLTSLSQYNHYRPFWNPSVQAMGACIYDASPNNCGSTAYRYVTQQAQPFVKVSCPRNPFLSCQVGIVYYN